ncbi:MAG: class IV adenylate cyclase [Bacteroidetes bacterium]|nr:class IV adenylate cyclase [Bacteroidota bacterium]
MPRNLEFKAKINEIVALEEAFKRDGASFVEILEQTDTYFVVPRGRLKLREATGKKAELIFYERDESSPEEMRSLYDVVPADLGMGEVLSKALGVKVVVSKKRRLLMLKNARIHLDAVDGLGAYLEFEVMSQGDDAGDAILLDRLKRIAAPFVEREINVSYSDLITLTRG